MTDSNESEPKIIVDDDWKSQVQAEKDALKEQESAAADESSSDESAGEQPTDEKPPVESPDAAKSEPDMELPPASFVMLVTTLSAQAMTALGFMPDPTTGTANPNRPMAKHFIDTLGVLEEKTSGNLTTEESNLLTETLHQLRMAFVTPPQ